MENLPPIGSLGPPADTELPWVQWAEIDNANDDEHDRSTAWKIYLVYLREGHTWAEDDHREMRHYFLISRVYRQSGETLTSPCPSQLWRAANLKFKNWTLALGHFLYTQYPENDRLQFWAENRRVYPGMPGGAVRPRTNADKDRESGLGIRTCNGTNNLAYMSISLGVDSYYPPAVIQPSGSEESLNILNATPEPLGDNISSQNSSREASYYTAYSPETALNNALRELEPIFERHDSKVAGSTRMSTPELPANLLQPIDQEEKSVGQEGAEVRQAVENQLNAIKTEITQLTEELSAHKRSAANRRADIRTDIRSTKEEQANSATDLHNLLSKITERVAKLERLFAEAGHSSQGVLDQSSGCISNAGDTSSSAVSTIQQQIAALQCMDRDLDLKLTKIQQSLASIQACSDKNLLEVEKDINYLKRKYVIDTLDIDIMKRQLAAQKNINTILINKISSMELQMGQSDSQTNQLHTLNNRLNIPSEE